MRKFSIPKSLYVLLILVLGVLSIGYTYAYFSSQHQAVANVQLGKVDIVWRDNSKLINNGANSILIMAEELKAGEFSKFQTFTDDQSSMRDSLLSVSNLDATASIYCRIKIDATYIPKNETTPIPCGEQWIQLAYKYAEDNIVLINGNGWFYDNGYYYYGVSSGITKRLTTLSARQGTYIADYLYLDSEVDAAIYGGSVSITLTAEAVQSTNNAYKAVWGVNW